MKLFEAEAYNTTARFKKDKIDEYLKNLIMLDESNGKPITTTTPDWEKAFELLSTNGINKTLEFEKRYKSGINIDGLPTSKIKIIHYSIEQSLSNLPGIEKKTYDYLVSQGIKTIPQFDEEYSIGRFNDENIVGSGLTTNEIEDVKILTERKNNAGLIRVYHSSVDINCADYIFNKEWADGPNSQAYGTGLYTVWTKTSAFDDKDIFGRRSWCPKDFYRDHAIEQGKEFRVNLETNEKINFRFEFLVDATDYFIGNWALFDQTHPDVKMKDGTPVNEHNFIKYQNEKFGTHVDESGDPQAVQSYFWGFWWKKNNKNDSYKRGHSNPHFVSETPDGKITEKDGPCIKGVAFVGRNDGDVVVAYDTKRAIPIRVSPGDKEKWFYIGGPGILSEAAQALRMGISEGINNLWEKLKKAYLKSLEEIFETHQGSSDLTETDFLTSKGRDILFDTSLETDILEGPEPSEANENGIFDNYVLKNCLYAKAYRLPMASVKNLKILNDKPADCGMITSMNNMALEIRDTARLVNCPNATLPWRDFINKENTGKMLIDNVRVNNNVWFKGFDQIILENIHNAEHIGFQDCGATSQKGKIVLNNVTSKSVTFCLNEMNEFNKIIIDGNCSIESINILTRSPDKGLNSLIVHDGSISDDTTFNFDIKTNVHRGIYKKDDVAVKHSMTFEELKDFINSDLVDDKGNHYDALSDFQEEMHFYFKNKIEIIK